MNNNPEIEMVLFYNSAPKSTSRSFENTKSYLQGLFAALENTICDVSFSKSTSSTRRRIIIIRFDRTRTDKVCGSESLRSILIDHLSVGESNEIVRMVSAFRQNVQTHIARSKPPLVKASNLNLQ